MNNNLFSVSPLIFFLILFINSTGNSQDTDRSLALKKNRPQKKHTIFYQPDLSYQLQKQFNLIRDANSGNALAQHELGLRYLLGEDGMTADTVRGAYWVCKAAEQKLPAACFNYSILLINGWGIDWNPFKAYDYLLVAANDGMPQAQHLIGILYTDNLVVKKDYFEAYRWIKKSSDQGYLPAVETKNDLEKYLPVNFLNSFQEENKNNILNQSVKNDTSLPSQLGLVFIDFDSFRDTIQEVTDKHLIEDLFRESNVLLADTLGLKLGSPDLSKINFENIHLLEIFAESGNSEALTILGRLYEKGIYFDKSIIKASLNYILASQLNYPRAKFLLLKIISQNFISEIVSEIKNKNNPDAMFVFHGLWALGLSHNIVKEEANKFLMDAVKLNHMPSIIELGNNYYTGKINNGNILKGINLWTQAAKDGSFQAKIRLGAVNIIDGINIEPIANSIHTLREALTYGSLLAQISLAVAYEKGIGVPQSTAEAVKYYRITAQRGNESAYDELKRIYDEIRPNEKRFSVN